MEAEPRRLNNADLVAFTQGDGRIIGNGIDSGSRYEVEFHKDGTIDGFSGSSSDYGTWEIVEDTICLKWDEWRFAERYCAYYVLLDDGSVDAFSPKGYHLSNSTGKFDWPKTATTTTPTPAKTATPPIVKTPQPQGSGSVEERLAKLKELLEKGLLTQDEAAEKRKEILKGL